jgi:hypothetical protein
MSEIRIILLLGLITVGLILLLISGVLGQIYLTPRFWQITGILVILFSLVLLRQKRSRNSNEKSKGLWEQQVDHLRKNGEKILIDLRKCKIRTSSFQRSENRVDYLDETSVIDILLRDTKVNRSDRITHSVLTYRHTLPNGKRITFYGPTEKDKNTLRILCEIQKTTFIYMDKIDPSLYYFDLEFIHS